MTQRTQLTLLFLCAAFATLMIPGDAKGPQSIDAPAFEVVESIEWSKNQSIYVYAWERSENVWRYGAMQGQHGGPFPSIATLEEHAHGFETIEALAEALPKDQLISMPITQIKVPGDIRAKMHRGLAKHKILFLGGC